MTREEALPYENLACSVVMLAVEDYRKALKALKKYSDNYTQKLMKEDCEEFFRNEIAMYTSIDGLAIMEQIRKEVGYDD